MKYLNEKEDNEKLHELFLYNNCSATEIRLLVLLGTLSKSLQNFQMSQIKMHECNNILIEIIAKF
jgi:dynactin complex subunit